ncbi:MAG: hypothetical protein EPO00_10950 [Chloroflexota bacterium]|nr:MAG: hypothetical protein EPO00_10950 [Chloroflexota bacterium]
MTDVDALVRRLASAGPRGFRDYPGEEQAWRGRLALMAVCAGASPAYAWAIALAPDVGGSDVEGQRAVADVSDDDLAEALLREGVRIDDLLPYLG